MKKIKLLILDIDGVMTNGTKIYDLDANVVGKSFHDHDFSAINYLKLKVPIIFLSKDDRVNRAMAEKRNIPFLHVQKNKDKSEYLEQLCEQYNCKPKEMAYVGDDVHDIKLLKQVGYAFCPSDAIKEVKNISYTINKKAGKGVINALRGIIKKLI
tara:strand:+ start:725 stop:1189 length:465 start_codon:yes stop_codon:yes gene_type:complete